MLIGFLGNGVSIFVSGQLAKLVKGFTDSELMIGGIRHVPAKYGPITVLMSEIPHQGSPRCSFQLLREISQ